MRCMIFALFLMRTSVQGAEPFLVVAYLPEYRVEAIRREQLEGLTDVVLFSVGIDAKGKVAWGKLEPKMIERMRELKKEMGFRLLLSVGGDGRSEGFAAMAAAEASRRRFIFDLLTLCDRYELNGIDLDWEHPNSAKEAADHAKLLNEIHKAFQPKKFRLTMAVAGWQELSPVTFQGVDFVHLMAYDADGKHSTLDFARFDLARTLEKGAKPQQVCLGLPFYGRNIKDHSIAMTYGEIVEKYHPGPTVDEVDGLYFNGPATIARKVKEAKAKGLAGVMIWEAGQDATGNRSLLKAIRDTGKAKP